jgi:hypothetical protein
MSYIGNPRKGFNVVAYNAQKRARIAKQGLRPLSGMWLAKGRPGFLEWYCMQMRAHRAPNRQSRHTMNLTEIVRTRFEIMDPEFFSIPLKKLAVESNLNTNRVYFLRGDRIVAVGLMKDKDR